MRWGGVLLALFIVLHILHFTTGTSGSRRRFAEGDVYGNVGRGFRIWWVAVFYVMAMIALGLHLYHGAWSSLRTLGSRSRRRNPLHRRDRARRRRPRLARASRSCRSPCLRGLS